MLECNFCGSVMNDLTHGKGFGRNFICNCGAHFYSKMISFFEDLYNDPQWFSRLQWESFVNGENDETKSRNY